MNNNEVDLLFPSRAIEPLRKLRGEEWEELIGNLLNLDPVDPDRVAFVLFMVRLSGCTTCQSDSFRAMRGCVVCATNTVKRHKGSDQNLIDLFNDAKKEIIGYLKEV
jgi:hypothetical protein